MAATTTMRGGFWYPDRHDLRRFPVGANVTTLPVGDAFGNRFAFAFPVRTSGAGVRLTLRDAVRIDLLDPDDAVLATRDWLGAWTLEYGQGVARVDYVLDVQWRTPVELAAGLEYRLLVTPTGALAVTVYSFPIADPSTPGTGSLIRRTGGVWTALDTRRAELALRITGL